VHVVAACVAEDVDVGTPYVQFPGNGIQIPPFVAVTTDPGKVELYVLVLSV